MRAFLETLESVCTRPGMYVRTGTFGEIVALADGYDLAKSGGVLAGFREWLIVRVDGGSNFGWSQLVVSATYPEVAGVVEESELDQKKLIANLLSLLQSYAEARESGGLRRIFVDFQAWLERQDWYDPESLSPGR